MGRPQFVNGVSDFMNVAKSRRGVGGDLKDGGAGMHGGQGVNPPGKSGLGGIISTQNIEDIIPYSASDVRAFSLNFFSVDLLLHLQGNLRSWL